MKAQVEKNLHNVFNLRTFPHIKLRLIQELLQSTILV